MVTFIITLDSFISAFPGHVNQSLHLSLDFSLLISSEPFGYGTLPPLDLDSSYLSLKNVINRTISSLIITFLSLVHGIVFVPVLTVVQFLSPPLLNFCIPIVT